MAGGQGSRSVSQRCTKLRVTEKRCIEKDVRIPREGKEVRLRDRPYAILPRPSDGTCPKVQKSYTSHSVSLYLGQTCMSIPKYIEAISRSAWSTIPQQRPTTALPKKYIKMPKSGVERPLPLQGLFPLAKPSGPPSLVPLSRCDYIRVWC